MQPAGPGAKVDGAAFRVVRPSLTAIPQAGTAVHAFLTVESRYAFWTRRDGLARASLNAHALTALAANSWKQEDHVIGITGRGLHLAADQQRILVRDE